MHRPDRERERRIQSEEATRERHDSHGPHPRRSVGAPPLVPDGAPEEYGRDHVPSESAFPAGQAHECGVSLVDATRLVDEERVGEMEGGRGGGGAGGAFVGRRRAAVIAGEVRPWFEHDGDGGARDVYCEDYVDYPLVGWHDDVMVKMVVVVGDGKHSAPLGILPD